MTPPPNQDKYKGSEKLTDAKGQVLSEAEKSYRDKLEAKKVTDQLLVASTEGKIKLPNGKEYSLTEAQKKELDSTLKGFVESGVKKFDTDSEAGLDEKEWRALEQAINLEAEKWLKIAREKAKEKLKGDIDKISVSTVEAKSDQISALVTAHAGYTSGDWKKINVEAAKIFGIKTEDGFDEELSLRFGTKIQQLIKSKLPDHDCGSAGKIGPLTMNGMAKMLAPAESEAPTQGQNPVAADKEAQPGSSEGEPPAAPDKLGPLPSTVFGKDSPLGFARLPETSEAQRVFDQFNPKQKAEMMEALLADEKEKLTPQQEIRLKQISLLQTMLQSLVSRVDESRGPEEWVRQVAEFESTTKQRKTELEGLLATLDSAAKQIAEDPNKTINDVVDPKIPRLLSEETVLYDLKQYTISPALRLLGPTYADAFIIDKLGKIKEAETPEELKLQYLAVFQGLRATRDFATAQMLIEDQLFKDLFEAKKKELFDAKAKQRYYDEAFSKIPSKFTPEIMQQYRDKNLDPFEVMKALAQDSADREMNKEIANSNKGMPFPNLKGADAALMASYSDMMGTGSWHNLSDATWDEICTEVIINAPLILVSGGVASLAAKGLTMGARAVIAGSRFAKIGLTVARTAEGGYEAVKFAKTSSRLLNAVGRTVQTTGKVGLMMGEGAVFETVHEGLTGELFEQDWTKLGTWGDWAKRCAVSGVTLKVFHGAGKLGAKADTLISKYITKVTDKSLAAMIQKLAVQKGTEVAAMVLVGAVQHGYVNGIEDMKDFDFWADQVFHAAVSVGALSIGGAGANRIVTIGGKVFRPKPPTDGGGGGKSTALVFRGEQGLAREGERGASARDKKGGDTSGRERIAREAPSAEFRALNDNFTGCEVGERLIVTFRPGEGKPQKISLVVEAKSGNKVKLKPKFAGRGAREYTLVAEKDGTTTLKSEDGTMDFKGVERLSRTETRPWEDHLGRGEGVAREASKPEQELELAVKEPSGKAGALLKRAGGQQLEAKRQVVAKQEPAREERGDRQTSERKGEAPLKTNEVKLSQHLDKAIAELRTILEGFGTRLSEAGRVVRGKIPSATDLAKRLEPIRAFLSKLDPRKLPSALREQYAKLKKSYEEAQIRKQEMEALEQATLSSERIRALRDRMQEVFRTSKSGDKITIQHQVKDSVTGPARLVSDTYIIEGMSLGNVKLRKVVPEGQTAEVCEYSLVRTSKMGNVSPEQKKAMEKAKVYLEPYELNLVNKTTGRADLRGIERFASYEVRLAELKKVKLKDVGTAEDLYDWLDAQGRQYKGQNTAEVKQAIREYLGSDSEAALSRISRGGEEIGELRLKVVELKELKRMEEVQRYISANKIPVDVELKGDVQFGKAGGAEVDATLQQWEGAQSADKGWGEIIGKKHSEAFRKAHPQKLEITFRNGTKVELIFSSKNLDKVRALQANLVKAEQWIQRQYGEYGVRPPNNLTVLVMDNFPGLKKIRGHGGTNHVLLQASELADGSNFLETYMHERTHSILGNSPAVGGVVEGAANFMAAKGVRELGLGEPKHLRASAEVGGVAKEILRITKTGKTLEQAFEEYLKTATNRYAKENYDLNYEYGQAFTEAMLKHRSGDLRQFLNLYKELGTQVNIFKDQHALLSYVMQKTGMPEADIKAVFQETAGIVMLKAYRGNDLMNILLKEAPVDSRAILEQQKLETIFGLERATLPELRQHVALAEDYIRRNAGQNQIGAEGIIRILSVKLRERESRARGQTQFGQAAAA